MMSVYWLTTLVGWAFALFFLFSGGDFDADVGIDVDLDPDIDADGIDAASSGPLAAILSFVSFRSLAFFAAFFGLAGLLLTWAGTGAVATFVLAVGVGGFAFWLNGALLEYLRGSSSDSSIRDRDIAGSPAVVTVPVDSERRGRVVAEVHGQRLTFTASPFKPSDQTNYDVGASVVIVEVDRGTARIAGLDALD